MESAKGNVATHIIIDYWVSTPKLLEQIETVADALNITAKAAGATVLNSMFHQFDPVGVTGCILLSKSHLSIHTWPELNYLAVDLCTCGNIDVEATLVVLENYFQPSEKVIRVLTRGKMPYPVLETHHEH